MQPVAGLDGAFLALETATAQFHVGAVLVLAAPEGEGPVPAVERFRRIRAMVGRRLHLVPQFRQRAVRLPLDLLLPLWADDPDFDLDDHLRRASLPAPGGDAELDDLVAELMSRPLPPDRPLWEMVVVEGLAGDRTALVAKLHHAILDGVSGASIMAALLDLVPDPPVRPADEPGAGDEWDPPPLPTAGGMVGRALSALAQQPEAVLDALRTGADALVGVRQHNRRLAQQGLSPPPLPFDAPPTPFNGTLSSSRRYAHLSVPLDVITGVRRSSADGVPSGVADAEDAGDRAGDGRPTFNDVVLSAVGLAVDRYLQGRGARPDRPLVALVPVSTRSDERARRADGGRSGSRPGSVGGNQVSGMLVQLGAPGEPPATRLARIAAASRVAKEQEQLGWGRLLEGLARATPHAVTAWVARGSGFLRLFDHVPAVCNLAVSTVPGPDMPLWVAGLPVVSAHPVGPVGHGVGLNVTTMTYRGTVHFGLLSCRRRLPDLGELADLLAAAVAELSAAASTEPPRDG